MSQTNGHLSDFVIVTALEEERDAVLAKLPNHRKAPATDDDVRVYFKADLSATLADGTLCTYLVIVICLPGMGRVNAASATSDAIRRWRPRYVFLVGIAGGVAGNGVNLGDVLVSDQIVDYELQKIRSDGPQVRWEVHRADQRLLDFSRNYIGQQWCDSIVTERPEPGMPARYIGPIATGDKVVAVDELLEAYRLQWPKLIGVEMEAGGVAHAAYQAALRPGFFMIRAVSDLAGNKDHPDVKRWRLYACDVAASYAIALLESGPATPSSYSLAAPAATLVDPDTLAQGMANVTFAELEVVTNYLLDQPAQPGVDFTLLDLEQKLAKNGLTSQTRDLLALGLSKVKLVQRYIEHVASLDSGFPEKVKAGFLHTYARLVEDGQSGDILFDGLVRFASRDSSELRYQAAALAVLAYLFESCEVFER
jgi:nucleoside phosphorylase